MAGEADKTELLKHLRQQITATDLQIVELLGSRHRLILEVGEVKRKNKMAVRDTKREDELVAILCSKGAEVGLSSDYIKAIYKVIIEHSVAKELEKVMK